MKLFNLFQSSGSKSPANNQTKYSNIPQYKVSSSPYSSLLHLDDVSSDTNEEQHEMLFFKKYNRRKNKVRSNGGGNVTTSQIGRLSSWHENVWKDSKRMSSCDFDFKDFDFNPSKFFQMNFAKRGNMEYVEGLIPEPKLELTFKEKQYLIAVEKGDVPTVSKILEEAQLYFHININCVDPLNRSALLIAIENDNLEMIELLLKYNIDTKDAILYAIAEEVVEAVELLLNYEEEKRLKGQSMEHANKEYESAFTTDITPLILAAHKDNYEIVKMLLDRGAKISRPHDVRCGCETCLAYSKADSLNHSLSRIHAYRALSSPSLISLTSRDPIMTAFTLSWELKQLSQMEYEFTAEYEELSTKCQRFATDLLDQTRTSDELAIILNHLESEKFMEMCSSSYSFYYDSGLAADDTSGLDGGKKDTSTGMFGKERMHLSRLKSAIKYQQKEFVSHPNCQQLLGAIWAEGLPGYRRRNLLTRMCIVLTISVFFPLLSICYIIAPKSMIGRVMRKPFIKFICNSASYITFLVLLILASQRIENITMIVQGEQQHIKNERRGSPPTTFEWMILAWIAGLIWSEVKQLWDCGFQDYLEDMWNVIDFITNALYIATITLRLIAYLQVQKEIAENNEAAFAPRKDWIANDPTLISEGLFAAANIFSSLKLVYIFTVNPYLGPLQITLGRMTFDILRFSIIIILVVFSFSCGLTQLYWYYGEMRAEECNRDKTSDSCQKRYQRFSNLFETVQTLYWAIYGLVDLENTELKEPHIYTEFIGLLMFGVYSAIAIVVLLNMLIAMMSNSYQLISNSADTEWKFARSKLWISYFDEGATLPPPFNMIPTPKSMYYFFRWCTDKIYSFFSVSHKRTKWRSLRKMFQKANEKEARYQMVIRSLVKRYVTNMQRKQQYSGVTEDDINEIKQEISSFRFEMMEIFKKCGFISPSDMKASDLNATRAKPNKKILQRERRLLKGSLEVGPVVQNQAVEDGPEKVKSGGIFGLGSGTKLSKYEFAAKLVEAKFSNSASIKRRRSSRGTTNHAHHHLGAIGGASGAARSLGKRAWDNLFDALKSQDITTLARKTKSHFGSRRSRKSTSSEDGGGSNSVRSKQDTMDKSPGGKHGSTKSKRGLKGADSIESLALADRSNQPEGSVAGGDELGSSRLARTLEQQRQQLEGADGSTSTLGQRDDIGEDNLTTSSSLGLIQLEHSGGDMGATQTTTFTTSPHTTIDPFQRTQQQQNNFVYPVTTPTNPFVGDLGPGLNRSGQQQPPPYNLVAKSTLDNLLTPTPILTPLFTSPSYPQQGSSGTPLSGYIRKLTDHSTIMLGEEVDTLPCITEQPESFLGPQGSVRSQRVVIPSATNVAGPSDKPTDICQQATGVPAGRSRPDRSESASGVGGLGQGSPYLRRQYPLDIEDVSSPPGSLTKGPMLRSISTHIPMAPPTTTQIPSTELGTVRPASATGIQRHQQTSKTDKPTVSTSGETEETRSQPTPSSSSKQLKTTAFYNI